MRPIAKSPALKSAIPKKGPHGPHRGSHAVPAGRLRTDHDFRSAFFKPGIAVQFENLGIWGRVIEIHHTGLKILNEGAAAPSHLEHRIIEVQFMKNLTLKAKFRNNKENIFYFDFLENQKPLLQKLNLWILNL